MRVSLAIAVVCLGLVTQVAAQPAAVTPVNSLVIEGSHTFCGGACKLYTLSVTSGSSAGFVEVFNLNFDPSDGALTQPPTYCWNWPASTGQGYTWAIGAQFTAGMTVVYSTGADCLHKTESATAFFTVQIQ
jgi:hypothetical protein